MEEQTERSFSRRQAIELLHRMNRTHWRLLDRRFASLGIHGGQHRLLMMLSRNGPAPAQTELAKCLDVTPASIAAMLKRLESGGYIGRQASAEDERRNQVTLTDKGRSVVATSKAIFDGMDRQMLAGFSDEDIAHLSAYLSRINDNLHAMEDALDAENTSETDRKDGTQS